MKLVSAFFRLIRWQNLLFIVLTQFLFYYCVYEPISNQPDIHKLLWLIAASVLIAAAGYIINDYFDLNIDQINKPGKNVFVRNISRRWAIVWHFLLSFLGVIATAESVGLNKWYLVLANLLCVFLLWFYSTSLKRSLLIGNIVISVLTGWTILVLFYAFTFVHNAFTASPVTIRLFRLAFLYGGFAFVLSLIREAVKDMEDMEGDAKYGCKTLPIVAGIRTTKVYVTIWLVVLIGALIVLQLYVLQFRWWLAVLYSFVFIIIPLVVVFQRLVKAVQTSDFANLSRIIKLIMFSGILSMIFFRIYF